MKLSSKKLRYWYSHYNEKVFHGHLPHCNEILFRVAKKEKKDIWAECIYYLESKKIELVFYNRRISPHTLFSEILLHEMIHIAQIMEHGTITGHGEDFFRFKVRLKKHGFRLKKSYP